MLLQILTTNNTWVETNGSVYPDIKHKWANRFNGLMRLTMVMVCSRDHSFPLQIFPNSAGQFAKFHGSPRQIYQIYPLIFYGPWTQPNMQYLSPVAATDRYSLSTKLTGNISDKLSLIFSVFLPSKPNWQSCISWWNHVYIQYGGPNSIKICRICPLITVQCRILQNSMKTNKFCRNGQIPRLGSKFRVLQKTVVSSLQ